MNVFRLKDSLLAVTHGTPAPTFVSLGMGTVVRTAKAGPMLPESGMVDVIVEGHDIPLAMFMRDLLERAEEIGSDEST